MHIQDFGGENLRERNDLGDPCIYGRIILVWILCFVDRAS